MPSRLTLARALKVSDSGIRGLGLVQQHQIDLREAQLLEPDGPLQIIWREVRSPDLGRHKNIVTIDTGRAQAFAGFALVLIHLRYVDMAVTEPERLLHETRAGPAAKLPCAQSDCWSARTIGFNELHRTPPVIEPKASQALCRW